VVFKDDAMNRLTNMVDGVGTTVYTYTSTGQLLTEDGPFTDDTVTNVYANELRVGLGLQQPTGNWTNGFGYDAARRLTSVTSPAGTFSYAYDPIRQMKPGGIALPTSSYVTNTYDPVARVLSTLLVKSTGSTLDGASYGYNVAGQRTSFTNAAGAYVDYAYDPIGQLMVATSSTSSQDRGYLYDAAWNLQQLTNNGSVKTYTVNGLNELTAIGSTSYSYDENGSPTATTTAISTSTNTYDAENRLIAAEETTVPPKLTTFIYDGLGRLRAQSQWVWTNSGGGGGDGDVEPNGSGGGGSGAWVLTNALYYVYDGTRVIEERNVNNAPTNAYTWGPDLSGTVEGAGGIGGMLARSSGYSSGNFTSNAYYHADGNGNITYLEDSSQDLAASYEYDPYGNTLSSSGPLASANTHRFSSKEYMAGPGLYYYLYRFYDPSLQRWPNRDPIEEEGGINLYAYVENDPVNRVDPLGLTWSSNWNFFWSWLFGRGQQNRNYGPNTTETQEMENSPGGDKLRNAFYNNGCKNVNNF